MVDVFDQVEEELRSDRYKRLARTWLPVVGGVLVVALIAALAWWGWQSWETSKADKGSIAYERGVESLRANNPVGADAAFIQAAKEGNGAYKAMALMQRSAIAIQDNRDAEALKFLDEAAKASRDPLISDLAGLKAAWLAMDTESLEALQARLEPLAKDGRPFAAFAQEAQAMALLQHGKSAEARGLLVVLKNGLDTPEIIQQRTELTIAAIDAGAAANLADIVKRMAAAPPTPRPAPSAGPAAGAPTQAPTPSPAPAAPTAAPEAPAARP